MKTYKTKEQAMEKCNRKSFGYDGVVYELYCEECGNTFFTVGFSDYRVAKCECGEDTDAMVKKVATW